jgi:8-oxo-dGTP pyrophosphatase MutT (NUDIX family)
LDSAGNQDIAWLRNQLARNRLPVSTIYVDDEKLPGEDKQRPASVLVPVIARAQPTVLFTVRASHLRSGSGQISFPGGGAEPGDPTPEHTALRETFEEIGLPGEQVEILGRFGHYVTRAGYRITPVIGVVQPPLTLKQNHDEVAEIFEVPLAFLLDPRNHQTHTHQSEGRLRRYFAIQYEDYYIRGVTAGLIVNLCRQVQA